MRLDQVIVSHIVGVLATVHATGKLCARRMVLQGEHVDAYLAGYQDALQAVAGALGIGDALNEAGMTTIDAEPRSLAASAEIAVAPTFAELTEREREVAECVAAGYSSADIARELVIEHATVKKHRQSIHGKIGTSDQRGLDAWLKAHAAPEPLPLTPREKEIARLIADGMRNEQIAERLALTGDTVRSHRQNLYRRLRVHSVAELLKYRRAFDEVAAEVPA